MRFLGLNHEEIEKMMDTKKILFIMAPASDERDGGPNVKEIIERALREAYIKVSKGTVSLRKLAPISYGVKL